MGRSVETEQGFQDLLKAIKETCGRSNCNCPGAPKVRKALEGLEDLRLSEETI